MDKKIAGLLGAVAALTSMNAANAATPAAPVPTETMQAGSYADLLNPIPNAVALLIADDTARSGKSLSEDMGGVQLAQHHHHHHHRYRRRHRHHHHHHHHSNFMAIPRADV